MNCALKTNEVIKEIEAFFWFLLKSFINCGTQGVTVVYGVNLFGRDFFAGLIDAGLIVIFANDKEAYLRLISIHLQEFCRGLNRDPHIAILAYVMIACNNSYR